MACNPSPLCCGDEAVRVFLPEVRCSACLACWQGWDVSKDGKPAGEVRPELRSGILERFPGEVETLQAIRAGKMP